MSLPRHARSVRFAAATLALCAATASVASDSQELPRVRPEQPSWMSVENDPAADGWGSEVFSDAASAQLSKLAKWTESREGDLTTIAAPGFRPGGFRIEGLEAVYERGALRVRRPTASWTPPSDSDLTGAPALKAAIERLERPLVGAIDRHAKFKIVEVAPEDAGTIGTRLLWQASGHVGETAVQLNGVWRARWRPGPGGIPSLHSIEVESYEEVRYGGPGQTMFSDLTVAAIGNDAAFREQLRYGNEYWMRRVQSVLGIDNYGHHGLAIADIDGDGLEDVYVCQTGGMPNRLFRQNPDGTATDVAAAAGVDFMDRTHAALLVDLDNDGDSDLVLATQAAVLFLANDGKGVFESVTRGGLPSAYTLAAADYDLDGDLDIYATAYVAPAEWERQGGLGLQPLPYHDANNGARNLLFRNEGDFEFTDATAATGLDANNRRWSFAAGWADYDEDGDPDLYVANDFGRNSLYRNDAGRFVDVAAEAGVEDSASGMSVSWGDYDGDGRIDLYVGNMFSSAGNRIVPQQAFRPGESAESRSAFRRFARGNTLYRNLGDGTFEDVSEAAGVTMGRWAWSSPFVDLDNDGRQDLLVANGYLTNENSKDL